MIRLHTTRFKWGRRSPFGVCPRVLSPLWKPLALALLLLVAVPAFAADQSQADRGHEVYQKWCTPCHGTGLGKPATSAAAAHGVKPAVLEQRTDLTPKMIETAVRNGVNFMPRFRKTEISNSDLAAIEAYLVHK